MIYKKVKKLFLFGILLVFSISVHAECRRWNPNERPPNLSPIDSGPGSKGELNNTATLGCLKYVGVIMKKGVEHAIVKDERGKTHFLKPGDYMGENNGMIIKIDEKTIHLKQIIYRNGQWEEVSIKINNEN